MEPKSAPADYPTYAEALLAGLTSRADQPVIWRGGTAITGQDFLDMIGLAATAIAPLLPPPAASGAPHRIGLMLHDNPSTIAAAVGAWLVGALPVILDHRQSLSELQLAVTSQTMALVLTRQKRLIGSLAQIKPFADLTPAAAPDATLAEARARIAEALRTPPAPDTLAEVITSSGVSGPPKYYPNSQKQLLAGALATAGNSHRGAWGAALSAISVVFGGARLIWWRNLLFGKPIFAMDLLFSAAELDRALSDPRVEECTLPPVLIRSLLRHAESHPGPIPRYPHLKKLQSIGGPAPAEEKLAAHHQLTHQYAMTYSSTETGVVTRIEGADLLARPESCGRARDGVVLQIIGEDERILGQGEVGRIRVDWPKSGASGWPGDRGWLDAERFLYIAGRGDGILCRNGVNFWAGAIETRLISDPDLLDAAVIALPGGTGDDGILLALRLAPRAELAPLLARLRARLATHERPDVVMVAEDDDMTPGGKIMRARLLARHNARTIEGQP